MGPSLFSYYISLNWDEKYYLQEANKHYQIFKLINYQII